MSCSKFKHVKVTGIAGIVPEKIINIDDEIQYYDNDIKKLNRIKKILGLGSRHNVETGVTSCDLCEAAARRLINEMNININEIDGLITSTVVSEHPVPSTAYILHGRLNLPETCTCLGLNGGCTGLLNAIWTGHCLIESGALKKVLILSGDIPSQRNDIRNRITSMLLADSGGAILLEYTPQETPSFFLTGSRGEKWDTLIIPAGGDNLPIRKDVSEIEETDKAGNVWHLWDDFMMGADVFNFTLEIAPQSIKNLLNYANLTNDDIDLFAIHQANKQIVNTIQKHTGLPAEKVPTEAFEKYANLSSLATLSVLLNGMTPDMKRVLMCSFGVGLSWNSCIIDVKNTYNGGFSIFKTPSNLMSREQKIEYWIKKFQNKP